ncbi:MAG: helix-turn-helix transcriptional regulator, partial [Nannocystaceae bacterium]
LRARVGERIREQAAKRGIALRQVAEQAGVSRGHLWNVLGGKSAASTDLLARIAKVLDVDPDVLVRRTRAPRSPPK